jgi:hypothetical protein
VAAAEFRNATESHAWCPLAYAASAALLLLAILVTPQSAFAQATRPVTIAWDPTPEPNLGGYVVMVGPAGGVAEEEFDVGLATSYTMQVLIQSPRVAWVHAYTREGLRSLPSNIVEIVAAENMDPLTLDGDADGLPDVWEARYGLGEPGDDPDRDGVPNRDESNRHTDPWLPNRWVFPDGSVDGFDERLALVNPGDEPARGVMVFRKSAGEERVPFEVAPRARATIDVGAVLGSSAGSFSTIVEVERGGVVAERTMRWAPGPGGELLAGHTGRGLSQAATTWYFAQGETRDTETFLLLANESDAGTATTVDFVGQNGVSIRRAYDVPARSRLSIHLNEVPGLSATFWIRVRATRPITAERATYMVRGTAWIGGDITAGAAEPSRTWYFGDAPTGFIFDSTIHLLNPQPFAVTANITCLQSGASPLRQSIALPPLSRTAVAVDAIPGLGSAAVSAAIAATAPVVAERSTSWPGWSTLWFENHTKVGTTTLGNRWLLAEGELRDNPTVETHLFLVNPGSAPAVVTVTIFREQGTPLTTSVNVAAESRAMLSLRDVRQPVGERFGLQIDSTRPIAVERSIYWSGQGWYTRGGTNEVGYRIR